MHTLHIFYFAFVVRSVARSLDRPSGRINADVMRFSSACAWNCDLCWFSICPMVRMRMHWIYAWVFWQNILSGAFRSSVGAFIEIYHLLPHSAHRPSRPGVNFFQCDHRFYSISSWHHRSMHHTLLLYLDILLYQFFFLFLLETWTLASSFHFFFSFLVGFQAAMKFSNKTKERIFVLARRKHTDSHTHTHWQTRLQKHQTCTQMKSRTTKSILCSIRTAKRANYTEEMGRIGVEGSAINSHHFNFNICNLHEHIWAAWWREKAS